MMREREIVGSDFPSGSVAGTCGTIVACNNEHPTRTDGAYLEDTIAHAKMAPRGVQWHARASARACQR